jgi:hypothetical protein
MCAKMQLVMVIHLNGQGSDHLPGSTPEKITRYVIGSLAPACGAVAPSASRLTGLQTCDALGSCIKTRK